MGCLGSKHDDRAQSGHKGEQQYNAALDGPPDFGLGDFYEVSNVAC